MNNYSVNNYHDQLFVYHYNLLLEYYLEESAVYNDIIPDIPNEQSEYEEVDDNDYSIN